VWLSAAAGHRATQFEICVHTGRRGLLKWWLRAACGRLVLEQSWLDWESSATQSGEVTDPQFAKSEVQQFGAELISLKVVQPGLTQFRDARRPPIVNRTHLLG
jgi:hypothetical protein